MMRLIARFVEISSLSSLVVSKAKSWSTSFIVRVEKVEMAMEERKRLNAVYFLFSNLVTSF